MLRFSFGGGLLGSVEDLRASLDEQLGTFEARHGLPAEYPDAHTVGRERVAAQAEPQVAAVLVVVPALQQNLGLRTPAFLGA